MYTDSILLAGLPVGSGDAARCRATDAASRWISTVPAGESVGVDRAGAGRTVLAAVEAQREVLQSDPSAGELSGAGRTRSARRQSR